MHILVGKTEVYLFSILIIQSPKVKLDNFEKVFDYLSKMPQTLFFANHKI